MNVIYLTEKQRNYIRSVVSANFANLRSRQKSVIISVLKSGWYRNGSFEQSVLNGIRNEFK